MEKIDIGHVKTTHRFKNGVGQTMRLFNRVQKRDIISQVNIGVEHHGMRVNDVLKMYEVSPVVYYSWLRSKKVKMTSVIYESEGVHVPSPIEIKRITIEVDINNVNDLFKMIHQFCKIEGVKSVSS